MNPSRIGASVFRPGAWLVLSMATLVMSHPLWAADPAPPTIQVRAGPAQLRVADEGRPWDPALPGQPVPYGTVVRTGLGFEGDLRYLDGTTLTLKPQTILQVLSDGLRLFRGQAWIKVVKRGRSFTCVTPSAIASVRGTSFSCEVPSMARVFGRRLRREFFDRRHLGAGMVGPTVSTSIGIAVLAHLLEETPGGRVPATVKVYEGRVLVSYPAHSGSIRQTWMLDPGQQVTTDLGERSIKVGLEPADYACWGLSASPTVAGATQPRRLVPDEPPDHGPTSSGTNNSVNLMNEPYDVR